MPATCSLDAAPLPVTACFTRRGAYSATGISWAKAAANATPWALPNLSMDCTFCPKNGASTAKSSGVRFNQGRNAVKDALQLEGVVLDFGHVQGPHFHEPTWLFPDTE